VNADVINYSFGSTPYAISTSSGKSQLDIEDGYGRVTIQLVNGIVDVDKDSGGSVPFTLTFWGGSNSNSGQMDIVEVELLLSGEAVAGPSIPSYQTREAHNSSQDYFIDDGYLITTPNLSAVRIPLSLYGISSTTLYVYPTADGRIENNEVVNITLGTITITVPGDAPASGMGVSLYSEVSMYINDDDVPAVVAISHRTNDSVSEVIGLTLGNIFGKDPNTSFYLSRTGSTRFSLDVTYSLHGTGTEMLDYYLRPILPINGPLATIDYKVRFPAGYSEAGIEIHVNDDGVTDPGETITVQLSSSDQYVLSDSAFQDTVTIVDNDSPPMIDGWQLVTTPPDYPNSPAYGNWIWNDTDSYWERKKEIIQWERSGNVLDATSNANQPLVNQSYSYQLGTPLQINFGFSLVAELNATYDFGANGNSQIAVDSPAPGVGYILGTQWMLATKYIFYQKYHGPAPDSAGSYPAGLVNGSASDNLVDETELIGRNYFNVNKAIYKRPI